MFKFPGIKNKKYFKLFYYLLLIVITSIAIAISADRYIYNRISISYINSINPYSEKSSVLNKKNLTARDIAYYNPILKNNVFDARINGPLINYSHKSNFASLNVKLIGTIKGKINYAFFLIPTGSLKKEIFVKTGSIIKNGFILYKVNLKSVIISKNGQTLKVSIIKEQSNANTNSQGAIPLNQNVPNAQNSILSLSRAIKKVGKYSYDINKSMIKKSELNSIFTQMHAVPDIIGNKIVGFKVLNIMPSGIFHYMGFKIGDIIKDINGTPLNSPQEAINLLSGIMYQNSVNVNIVRGNKKLTLSYSIQ